MLYFATGKVTNRVVAQRVRSTTSSIVLRCSSSRLQPSRVVAAQADVAERPPAVTFEAPSKEEPLKIGVNGVPR